jgi:glycosyltransferase involved in cell wall biosynthesis
MEVMLETAVPRWRSHSIETHILGQGSKHPYRRNLTAAGASVTTTTRPGTLSSFRHLAATVTQIAPDVVHLHSEKSYALTVLAVRTADRNVPIIRTVHNIFGTDGKWGQQRRMQAAVADRFVDAITVPSSDVAVNEKRLGRHPMIIKNWVHDNYHVLRRHRQDFLSSTLEVKNRRAVIVGNCSHIKRHELALSALLELNFTLVHLGDESGASELEKELLKRFDKENRLGFRGIGDPSAWLREATVFLMPSKREGMSVALAEALAAGVPALVADSPGFQWVRGSSDVELLPADELSWREALQRLGNLPRLAGFDASELTLGHGATKYEGLYHDVRDKRNRRVNEGL